MNIAIQNITRNESVTLYGSDTFTKSGYALSGWKATDGTTYPTGQTVTDGFDEDNTVLYAIWGKDISQAIITIFPESYSYSSGDQTYNYSGCTPALTVTWNGTNLTKDTHYTVSYTGDSGTLDHSGSFNPATATGTVTATGIGEYAGTLTKTYTISHTYVKPYFYVYTRPFMETIEETGDKWCPDHTDEGWDFSYWDGLTAYYTCNYTNVTISFAVEAKGDGQGRELSTLYGTTSITFTTKDTPPLAWNSELTCSLDWSQRGRRYGGIALHNGTKYLYFCNSGTPFNLNIDIAYFNKDTEGENFYWTWRETDLSFSSLKKGSQARGTWENDIKSETGTTYHYYAHIVATITELS